jgi:hypothetical protein
MAGRISIKTGTIALLAAVSVALLGAAIYWVRPSLGRPVLETALVMLFLLFLTLGIAPLVRDRFALKAASLGFSIAILLGAIAFSTTRPGHNIPVSGLVYLTLCPPSIGSMALDNASLLGALVGWLFIAVENAALYALLGAILRRLWKPFGKPSNPAPD